MRSHQHCLSVLASGAIAFLTPSLSIAQQSSSACAAQSTGSITPVIELYTSEGCSSCPPADKWLSTLKSTNNVVQAFHVNYWDYIGWTDRFATPAHTVRQRQVSAWQNSGQIYTPQMVRNGRDWRNWGHAPAPETATLSITLKQERDTLFSAQIAPIGTDASQRWAAYWTVTEHGHSSKVLRGENSGEQLKHDFVVRQYQSAGEHTGASKLVLQSIAKDPAYARQINLVVFNPQTGKPLQALSLSCG
jgi:hypothetical protein